jgi:hypothetical protein
VGEHHYRHRSGTLTTGQRGDGLNAGLATQHQVGQYHLRPAASGQLGYRGVGRRLADNGDVGCLLKLAAQAATAAGVALAEHHPNHHSLRFLGRAVAASPQPTIPPSEECEVSSWPQLGNRLATTLQPVGVQRRNGSSRWMNL